MGLTVGWAGHGHQAGHPLDDVIIARAFGVGAGLAEACDRAIDQTRVERCKAIVVEPVFGKPTYLEVLDQDIGIGHKAAHLRLAFGGAEINHHRFLATIAAMEIGRSLFAIVVHKGGTPLARVIPLGAFDLDDFSTKIRKRLTGKRARKDPRQFHNFQACKRLHCNSFSSCKG